MSPAQAMTTEWCEAPQVQHCLLCRRVRRFHRNDSPPETSPEWEELTDFLTHYGLTLSSLVVVDAYCERCETFYRQLLTYGQPERRIVGSTTSGQVRT